MNIIRIYETYMKRVENDKSTLTLYLRVKKHSQFLSGDIFCRRHCQLFNYVDSSGPKVNLEDLSYAMAPDLLHLL